MQARQIWMMLGAVFRDDISRSNSFPFFQFRCFVFFKTNLTHSISALTKWTQLCWCAIPSSSSSSSLNSDNKCARYNNNIFVSCLCVCVCCAGFKRRWKSTAFPRRKSSRRRICTSVATFRKSRSASTPWVDWYVTHTHKCAHTTSALAGDCFFHERNNSANAQRLELGELLNFVVLLYIFFSFSTVMSSHHADAEASRIHRSSHGTQNGRQEWTRVHRGAITCSRGTRRTPGRI